MAGGAAKKASTRQRRAIVIYGGIVAAINVLFFVLRYAVWKQPLTRREWTGVLSLAGMYTLCVWNLISSAALDVTPEAAVDLLALAAVTQLSSLYSPRGWWLLALVPVYFAYSFAGPLAGLMGKGAGAGGGAALGKDDDGEGGGSEMDEKRRRRAEHKAKARGMATLRR
jgi:hypothetical protein